MSLGFEIKSKGNKSKIKRCVCGGGGDYIKLKKKPSAQQRKCYDAVHGVAKSQTRLSD